MSAESNAPGADAVVLESLIRLCNELAEDSPAGEDALRDLTRLGAATPGLARLTEAFARMQVKAAERKAYQASLLHELEQSSIEREQLRAELRERNVHIVKTLQRDYHVRRVIGHCDAMKLVVRQALAIARRPINTLILGPTGTGKEVIAQTIHYHSPRRDSPFVTVNCTAIPDTLFESQMFGIERGVATGVMARPGLVEQASGGTLFLDEVGDMQLANQAKLLRVLQEQEVMRVGSSKPVPVDIKLIAATNLDLDVAVREGRFREDLYYRINVAELRLPPLRERGDDIVMLARHLLERHAQAMDRPGLSLAPLTRQCLLAYSWPGNVRELDNEMERAAALAPDKVIRPTDLSPRILAALTKSGIGVKEAAEGQAPSPAALPDHVYNLEQAERLIVERALKASGGNKSRAAELLGITREGLRKKLSRMSTTEDGGGDLP